MKQHSRKVFRTSVGAKGCSCFCLLGVAGLFWVRITSGGSLWASSLLVLPLFLLFGAILKDAIQDRFIIDAESLFFSVCQKRKQFRYEEINQVQFGRILGFDTGPAELWMIFSLIHPLEPRDENSINVSQWFHVTNPEQTYALNVAIFDMKTIAEILLSLARIFPPGQVVFGGTKSFTETVRTALDKVGGNTQYDPQREIWIVMSRG